MKITTKAKKLWDDNKGTLAVAALTTTLVVAYLYGRHVGITNNFLADRGLTEEFYGF